jgi:hypothetical protein
MVLLLELSPKAASEAGVVVVVVVDFVVLAGSEEGVVLLVAVVVDLAASGTGVVMFVVAVIDLVALEPGVMLVLVVIDLFTFAAVLRASSIIMAISMTTNIFFISKPLFYCDLYESRLLHLNIIHKAYRGQ